MSKLLLASALAVALLPGPLFRPMELVSAGDVPYPWASVADGVVVLRVAADPAGKVTGTSAVRAIASLTEPATAAVKTWKFRPAVAPQGASEMTVAVVFRPAGNPVTPPVFAGAHLAAESSYAPVGIRTVSYPDYPWNVVASGTVVLQVAVDVAGRPGAVDVIRGIVPLTDFAKLAVKTWQFEAATWNGKPMPSKIVVAFVFRVPVVAP
jgi:protein TonB